MKTLLGYVYLKRFIAEKGLGDSEEINYVIREKFNLNIDRLINLRDERENKVLVEYDKLYNSCLMKITNANELNKTSVVFNVPESVIGYFNYSAKSCIDFINKKLENEKFDTLVLSNNSLYISWLNLGKNRESKPQSTSHVDQ